MWRSIRIWPIGKIFVTKNKILDVPQESEVFEEICNMCWILIKTGQMAMPTL